jgi:hypothetical protein
MKQKKRKQAVYSKETTCLMAIFALLREKEGK